MEWLKVGSDIDGEAENDSSGFSVSLSADGTRVAIGAIYNDGNGSTAGHVRIYEFSSTTGWSQLGSDIDGEASDDYSSWSVSLSADGTRVAIGAIGNDGTGSSAGHVRIYEFSDATGWSQLGSDINGEGIIDQSGYSVSLSDNGSRVAIGAPFNDGNGSDAGHVRIYEFSSTTGWSQLGADINGEAAYDHSGDSVSLSADGTRVAIGAHLNGSSYSYKGHVRIYEFSSTTGWSQLGQDIDGEAASDFSGWSVSLSADGTRVAIGASRNDGTGGDAGHVRIYEFSTTTNTWSQVGQDIDGEAEHDYSGYSVSLSADGTRVAIGAIYNDGNGSSAGHVRIYEFSTTTGWSQLGADINGEAENDSSGFSVSLSADGTRVAIGAVWNDPTINGATANDAGHVRIYELVSTTTTTTTTEAPTTTTTTEAPTHKTILSLESVGTSMNETTGKTNYVWQLKASTSLI